MAASRAGEMPLRTRTETNRQQHGAHNEVVKGASRHTSTSTESGESPASQVIECRRKNSKGETIITHRYYKGRLLGKGGFAHCYKVTCADTMRVYAMKIVPKSTLTKTRARQKLQTEIKIHRTLAHPRIVRFEMFFEDKENVYILLELCANHSLSELIRRTKRFTEDEARRYMLQILEATSYLHRHQIIHRDLKLGNVFLDKDWNVKMGDFGLATKLVQDSERKRTICGTPNYIAPEILEGSAGHSYQVDLWSAGVILYTMLVGRPPYESTDVKSTYRRILANVYAFPDSVPVSDSAKNLVGRLLQVKPELRPSLDEILDHPFLRNGGPPQRFSTIHGLRGPSSSSSSVSASNGSGAGALASAPSTSSAPPSTSTSRGAQKSASDRGAGRTAAGGRPPLTNRNANVEGSGGDGAQGEGSQGARARSTATSSDGASGTAEGGERGGVGKAGNGNGNGGGVAVSTKRSSASTRPSRTSVAAAPVSTTSGPTAVAPPSRTSTTRKTNPKAFEIFCDDRAGAVGVAGGRPSPSGVRQGPGGSATKRASPSDARRREPALAEHRSPEEDKENDPRSLFRTSARISARGAVSRRPLSRAASTVGAGEARSGRSGAGGGSGNSSSGGSSGGSGGAGGSSTGLVASSGAAKASGGVRRPLLRAASSVVPSQASAEGRGGVLTRSAAASPPTSGLGACGGSAATSSAASSTTRSGAGGGLEKAGSPRPRVSRRGGAGAAAAAAAAAAVVVAAGAMGGAGGRSPATARPLSRITSPPAARAEANGTGRVAGTRSTTTEGGVRVGVGVGVGVGALPLRVPTAPEKAEPMGSTSASLPRKPEPPASGSARGGRPSTRLLRRVASTASVGSSSGYRTSSLSSSSSSSSSSQAASRATPGGGAGAVPGGRETRVPTRPPGELPASSSQVSSSQAPSASPASPASSPASQQRPATGRSKRDTLESMHDLLTQSFAAEAGDTGEEASCGAIAAGKNGAVPSECSSAAVGVGVGVEKEVPPPVWVTRYVDYSCKYGLGFLLSDGSAGVYFNDATKIVLDPSGVEFDYIERARRSSLPGARGAGEAGQENAAAAAAADGQGDDGEQLPRMRYTMNDFPTSLKKKVTLLNHFRGYLHELVKKDEGAGGAGGAAVAAAAAGRAAAAKAAAKRGTGSSGTSPPFTFLKKWLRARNAILFRLSNRTVQVVFSDQTEILLSKEARVVTYVDKDGNRETHALQKILQEQRPDVTKRVRYSKELIAQLVRRA